MKTICRRFTALFLMPLLVMVAIVTKAQTSETPGAIVSGSKWNDTNGKRIQAHGGGILMRDGTYYWHGEDIADILHGLEQIKEKSAQFDFPYCAMDVKFLKAK